MLLSKRPPGWRQNMAKLRYLSRAMRLVWESGRGWAIANLFLFFLQGLIPLLSLYLIKLIVDAVDQAVTEPAVEVDLQYILLLVALAGGVALLGVLMRLLSTMVAEIQALVVTDRVQEILHAKSIEVDLEYYENSDYYDSLHRAQNEAPYRPTRIVQDLLRIGQSGISLIAIGGLLVFGLDWWFAAILLAAAVPGVLVRLKYADKIYQWRRRRTSTERKVFYFNWLLTGGQHAKEIRIFELGRLFKDRARELRDVMRKERLQIAVRRSMADLGGQSAQILVVFGSLAVIVWRTVKGMITLGDMVMYFQALQRGQGYLQELTSAFSNLYENNLFLSHLYEFLELEPRVRDPESPAPVPRPLKQGLAVENLTFRYPGSEKEALREINLEIRAGDVVALVGENGSGKTTLVKMLCRLYDPQNGKITLDGIDIREFSTESHRQQFSVIFQDYGKYHLTARENIWFGNVDLPPGDQSIELAAEKSGAAEVIHRLPHGYETVLGKWFEKGEELSVGQWQKLALARAFLRDAQVLILDEPTSSMDPKAEAEVFERFRQLAEGRTTILISHRLSTVKMANRIFVMDNGTIIEEGTHDELMERRGRYAYLFETQAEPYR